MRSLLFAALLFFFSSCFVRRINVGIPKKTLIESEHPTLVSVFDMNVQRLSSSRVRISWHSKDVNEIRGFEVMRKIGKYGIFEKIGFVEVNKNTAGINDYSLTDLNPHSDSSFYSIKQLDDKGAAYFSKPKGIQGRSDN
jgi:hypothetical protein